MLVHCRVTETVKAPKTFLPPSTHLDSHLPESLHHCQFTPQESKSASELGPQNHQDAEQFITPSTWICEKELRSVSKMTGIRGLAQKLSFKSTHCVTPELNTEDTEVVICNSPPQPPFYNHSFLPSAKFQNNANRESSVPKHKKGRTDYHLLLLCQPKPKHTHC